MNHPLILGIKTQISSDPLIYHVRPSDHREMNWRNRLQSAFAWQRDDVSVDPGVVLLSLDQNNAYKMLEEYEFSFTSSAEQLCICFQAPTDGRLTVVRRWEDKYLMVFMPYSYYEGWLFSSSSTPGFRRLHGNAWIFGKYSVRTDDESPAWNEVGTGLLFRDILVSWLMSTDPTEIYVMLGATTTPAVTNEDIVRIREAVDPDKLTIAWEIARTFVTSHAAQLFEPDSSIWLPIKEGSIVPILDIDNVLIRERSIYPNLKLGVVDIPNGAAGPALNSKWTYFDSSAVLHNLRESFEPPLNLTPVSSDSHINAWYPIESTEDVNNRVLQIELGHFRLINPLQTIDPALEKISSTVLFQNPVDAPVLFGGPNTNWSLRHLDKYLATPSGTPAVSASFTMPPLRHSEYTLPSVPANPTISFTNVKAEFSSSVHHVTIPTRLALYGEELKDHLIRIVGEEYDTWHYPVPLDETNSAIFPRLRSYWRDGVGRNGPTDVQLANEAWQEANPWSAAFISFVMKQAGRAIRLAGNLLNSFFQYAAGHTVYLNWAKQNRVQQLQDRAYWLYDLADLRDDDGNPLTIEPGDLLAKNRWYKDTSGNWVLSTSTYAQMSGNSHADIVEKVRTDRLILIGGNVDDRVDRRTVYLLDDKSINREVQYMIGEDFNSLSHGAELSDAIGPSNHNQTQFFALMKLRL
jgi:hypothetical protein